METLADRNFFVPTTKSNQILFLLGFLIILTSSGGGGGETNNARATSLDVVDSGEFAVRRPVGNPCGASEFSVSFDEGVSLGSSQASTAGTSNTGPFELALPEGTYKVTLSTWLGEHELAQETNEQWFFTTNSGYSSPTTIDSSPHLLINQAFDDQEIPAATTIELHHRGADQNDIENVVHPLCIGFDTAGLQASDDDLGESDVSVIAASDLLP